MQSGSVASVIAGDDVQLPPKAKTLKKKSSLGRARSLTRSTHRSVRAGSVRSLSLHPVSSAEQLHSAFYCPVPTSGSPTDVLVNRFQTWRRLLKDLISYYREVQLCYEQRARSLSKLSTVANNIATPSSFLPTAGIDDALEYIRQHNKNASLEAQRAKEIEEDVILALTGLRSDLQQKIKEIKHLSSDFKNTVDKEMEGTAKGVRALNEVLERSETDAWEMSGKSDPYLLRMAIDRQIERQLDEENYLHQAYLNLEGSGRELESIVVGEIQKAYNAYAGILKREADNAYSLVLELRDGPLSMPPDREWRHFVKHDDQVIDPTVALRSPEQIRYPGQDHYAAQEIRGGLLERKSKYLKSYTAGWYVLSTTHLHEFKSADKAQAPIMSLYLPHQKLGSHSLEHGSNKFVLKGRQTGSMHRGHTWVFRAESYDTMMAWFEDIKALTENTPEERSVFVHAHSRRRASLESSRQSASSDGLDEEDEEPFRATEDAIYPDPRPDVLTRRPQPGGRFPSDIQVNAQRGLLAPRSPSQSSSREMKPEVRMAFTEAYVNDHGADGTNGTNGANGINGANGTSGTNGTNGANGANGANGLNGDSHTRYGSNGEVLMRDMHSQAAIARVQAQLDSVNPYTSEPLPRPPVQQQQQQQQGNTGVDGDYFMTPIVTAQTVQEQTADDRPDHVALEGIYSGGTDDGIMPRMGETVVSAGDLDAASHGDDVGLDPHDTEGLQVVADADRLNGDGARPAGQRSDSALTVTALAMPGGFPGG